MVGYFLFCIFVVSNNKTFYMATRSTITVRTGANERVQIYCHWDGYVDYNGLMLFKHYNHPTKAKNLVRLGDISSLREFIHPLKHIPHDFYNPQGNVTVAYGRDRGETGVEGIVLTNAESGRSESYDYFYDGSKWFVDGRCLETILKDRNLI